VSYHMDASRGGAVPAVSGSMSATGPGRTNSRVTICVKHGSHQNFVSQLRSKTVVTLMWTVLTQLRIWIGGNRLASLRLCLHVLIRIGFT
jgi:hypothetical protein